MSIGGWFVERTLRLAKMSVEQSHIIP